VVSAAVEEGVGTEQVRSIGGKEGAIEIDGRGGGVGSRVVGGKEWALS